MLKKLFLFALTACTLAACNKDEGTGLPYDYVYLKENTNISEGHLQGSNMHFYGTSTVTDATGGVFTYRKAHFELAGLDDFHLYMHKTRFAADMPGVEMRIPNVPYTPTGDKSLTFSLDEVIPEAERPNAVGGGATYVPVERYVITQLAGSIDNTLCRVEFTCAGVYHVRFRGQSDRRKVNFFLPLHGQKNVHDHETRIQTLCR